MAETSIGKLKESKIASKSIPAFGLINKYHTIRNVSNMNLFSKV